MNMFKQVIPKNGFEAQRTAGEGGACAAYSWHRFSRHKGRQVQPGRQRDSAPTPNSLTDVLPGQRNDPSQKRNSMLGRPFASCSMLRPTRVAASLLALFLVACATDTGKDLSADIALPSCALLKELSDKSGNEFAMLKAGEKRSGPWPMRDYWDAAVTIAGASRCVVQAEYDGSQRYECSWEHGDAAMLRNYSLLRDHVASCFRSSEEIEAAVGLTFVKPLAGPNGLVFVIHADYYMPLRPVRLEIRSEHT